MVVALVVFGAACRPQQIPNTPPTPVPLPAPAPAAGFTGRVVDFTTALGVAGAKVSFGETTATTGWDGTYVLDIPVGVYEPVIDGVRVGLARVTGPSYRGDFFVRTGTCIGRYGTVVDRGTALPIVGATVSLGGQQVVTGMDGWYRIDLACPAPGIIGFNTALLGVSHAEYTNASWIVGRGIAGATRIDIDMNRR
jgi:hypothetical protein